MAVWKRRQRQSADLAVDGRGPRRGGGQGHGRQRGDVQILILSSAAPRCRRVWPRVVVGPSRGLTGPHWAPTSSWGR